MKRIIITALIAVVLTSCGDKGKDSLPAISGKAGEVEVVANKALWESEPGAAIRDLLAQVCPFLPQPEEMYDLFNVPPKAFNKLFKAHRNIIYLNVSEDKSQPALEVKYNVWAEPQLVIYIQAPDAASVTKLINEQGKTILESISTAELNRLLAAGKNYEEKEPGKQVRALMVGSPKFPTGYSTKKITDDFVWVSYESTYTNQSILVYKYPYTGPEQFTAEALAAKRNEFTKQNIPCTKEGSYVIINPMIAPGFEMKTYNGKEFAELRGLWDAYNDYMGGPFVSHAFLDKTKENIIVVDAFVYAPKYPKRSYIRQVESILYSYE